MNSVNIWLLSLCKIRVSRISVGSIPITPAQARFLLTTDRIQQRDSTVTALHAWPLSVMPLDASSGRKHAARQSVRLDHLFFPHLRWRQMYRLSCKQRLCHDSQNGLREFQPLSMQTKHRQHTVQGHTLLCQHSQ